VRLLIVCGDYRLGGAETVAAELTAGLVARGHQVVVASIAKGGAMAEVFAKHGATVHEGLARRSIDPLAPLRFARLICREGIDVLMVLDPLRNGLLYALSGSLLARRSVGRLCWCHSWPGGQAGRFHLPLAAYHHLGLLTAVVCVSRGQREAIAGRLLPRRILPVIHNGLDFAPPARPADRAALGIPPDKRMVIQVANAMPDKDFQSLLCAARLLVDRRSDFHLLLVGRGTDGQQMARQIHQQGLEGVVTALGPRKDVSELLAAADVFVLSSKRETFGLAPLEAMAAGLPVVVSDLPGLDDLFTDGRHGLKVPPGDAEALAEAIGRLLDDPQLAQRLGQAGQARARQFGAEKMVQRFERLLRLVCPARAGQGIRATR